MWLWLATQICTADPKNADIGQNALASNVPATAKTLSRIASDTAMPMVDGPLKSTYLDVTAISMGVPNDF
jgi:hypothetical protein